MATLEPTHTTRGQSHTLAGSAVLSGALCLSVSAILVKLAGVDAATTAMLRCAIALLVLIPLALSERDRRGAVSQRDVFWAIAAGAALGVDYAAWTAAIYQVGAGISTVLINVQVIVLPALAFLVDRERIAARFVWALPLMLLGIVLVSGLSSSTAVNDRAASGTLLGLLAGIGYGVYLFLTRRATKDRPRRMVQSLTWATASAAVVTTFLSMLSGGVHLDGISARSWGLLGLLAVLGQVIAWLLVHHGSARLEPATTAALLLLQPVLALGLAAVALAEHPTPIQLLGAALIIASVALSNGLLRHRKPPEVAEPHRT